MKTIYIGSNRRYSVVGKSWEFSPLWLGSNDKDTFKVNGKYLYHLSHDYDDDTVQVKCSCCGQVREFPRTDKFKIIEKSVNKLTYKIIRLKPYKAGLVPSKNEDE